MINIKLNDIIEVSVYVDAKGEYTLDSRKALGFIRNDYVRVIGEQFVPFINIETYLIGWEAMNDVSHYLVGAMKDFQLSSHIDDFEKYPKRWWVRDGVKVISVLSNLEDKVPVKPTGVKCRGCLEFYEFAEANEPDGKLLCFVCRNHYAWKYIK